MQKNVKTFPIIPALPRPDQSEVSREPMDIVLHHMKQGVLSGGNNPDVVSSIFRTVESLITELPAIGEFSAEAIRQYLQIAAMRIDVHQIQGDDTLPVFAHPDLAIWQEDSQALVQDGFVAIALGPNRLYEYPVYVEEGKPVYQLQTWLDGTEGFGSIYGGADKTYGYARNLPRLIYEFGYSSSGTKVRTLSCYGSSTKWEPLQK